MQVTSFLVSDPETGAPMALATVQSDLREVVAGREAVQEQIAHQRGLLHHLHEAQETERARIAADIHDDTVQVMAAVNLRLQSLRRSLEPVLSPEQSAVLGTMDATVREASGRLRRLLVELDQPAVDAADVGAALRKTADESSVVGGPSVTVDVRVERDPSPIVARALVRIAHEALTNVRKHAEADTALVRLGQVAGDYLLQVVDDGRGLAPDTDLRAGTHRGVRGMRERAESVGGSLTVAPRSVGGVVVEARVPNLLGYPDAGGAASGPRIFLEQVMETITDCYCALDADWRYVYLNRAGYALLRRDPADPVVGKLVWDEFEIGPEFAAAWHRAREEQVEVEVTGYVEAWDIWIHNRVLPTAGGLSIFARDVSDEVRATRATRVHARLVQAGRALSHAIAAGGQDDATVVRNAAAAIVETWPVRGLRVGWPGGAVEAGDLTGPVRRVPLAVAGREVGEVEIVGEDDDPVDPDLLHLLAVRLSAVASGSRDDLVEAETSRTSDP